MGKGRKQGFLTLIVLLLVGLVGWYLYNTGELLNILNWLIGQDPILLVVVAVVSLIGIAIIMGG